MKLTEITKIVDLQPIPNADRIERAKVKGWDCVVQKGIHKVGDLVCFIYPDTLVPKKFLDPSYEGNDKIRLKTAKIRGQFSAGLVLPISCLNIENLEEGKDIADQIGVEKYEKPIPINLLGEVKGQFPTVLIPKTDEDNWRSNLEAVEEMRNCGVPLIATYKQDGTSVTYIFHNEEFKVCSRNLELKKGPNIYWETAEKYNIENILVNHFENTGMELAIQGEICDPKVNGGNVGCGPKTLYVFLIKNITTNEWLPFEYMKFFCEQNKLQIVPIAEELNSFINSSSLDMEKLQEEVNKLKYPSGKYAEGIVLRPIVPVYSRALEKSWLSLKILNQNYKD